MGANARECHRCALVDFNFEAVGNESHDAGRLHPGNLLELRLALGQRDEKDVAADVAAQNFHHLRTSDVVRAGNLDVVAGLNAKAPGTLAVAVERRSGHPSRAQKDKRQDSPLQPIDRFFGEGTAPNRDAFLPAQKRRLLIRIQVEQACVIPIGTSPPVCGWVKVFPRDGRTSFPRHQLRTIVASESPVLDTITAFALWRIEKIWFFCTALVPTRMREARSSPAQMTSGNKRKQDETR